MTDPTLTRQVERDPVLHLFLESITDQAVFTVDPEGIITTWSEGCRRIKRYTSEEVIGQHFRMLYTIDDQARGHPEDNLRRALQDGQYHEERIRLRKGGEPFMAEVSIYPLEENGRFAGFAKIVKDVSERKRLGDQRDVLQEELRLSNIELEGFCHTIAHDLHSPIRAIISNCRIVQEDYAPILPGEAHVYLDSLVRNGLRLGQLIDDLLRFARLGQDALKRRRVDVSAMAERLAIEIGPTCQDGSALIEVQDGVRANADSSMLEFVLRNLMENSCKYSHPGVRIHFGMDVVDGEPVYHIRDDGIGFDMQYVHKLFEPFQRLHRNDAYKGTGIGLANVSRIVERHGGKVWAESVEGKGSTFYFTLGEAFLA